MNRALRILILSGGVLAAGVLAAGAALAASVAASGGLVVVRVDAAEGPPLRLPIPVALVRAGLGAASHLGGEELARGRRRLEPWQPLLTELIAELDEQPSFVLADVRAEHGSLRIVKTRSRLEIDAHGTDGELHVSLPLALARELAAFAG